MKTPSFLKIYPKGEGREFSSFDLYLPAGGDGFYTQYRFVYEKDPIKPELHYGIGPNDPANRELYRIKKAFVGKMEGESFLPAFRALSGGEIGLAFREVGAGDFVGGIHGDEVMTRVKLEVNGKELALNAPFFGAVESFSFFMDSEMFRCNTPKEKLILHRQRHTVKENTLCLDQDIEWIADGRELQKVYSPMLTAQRLNPDRLEQILSDTVELYAADGRLCTTYDTTPYGVEGNGEPWVTVCENTPATRAKVYGKTSGFCAEAGYTVKDGSVPDEQINTALCIRYRKNTVDNKIYFDLAGGTTPKAGTRWRLDIFYRITYDPERI